MSTVRSLEGLLDAKQLQKLAENLFSDCLQLPHIPNRINEEGKLALQILSQLDNPKSEGPCFIHKPSNPALNALSRTVLEYLKPGAVVTQVATDSDIMSKPLPSKQVAMKTVAVTTGISLIETVCNGW